jgi:threonine synthase
MNGCAGWSLDEPVYECPECGGLLEVELADDLLASRTAGEWRELLAGRPLGLAGSSGVWRYREWVLPDLEDDHIVSLGEGGTPLVAARRLSADLGVRLWVKQCGQSASGSFKDLGMTVLISQVHQMRRHGRSIPAVACASTGDTSAALAAYGAAANIPTLVLLPRGKVSEAQLLQPLAHGARVLAIDSDFDGCMRHVQRLSEEGVYLANSKNSLRIEGQKTVAFEIAEALGWRVPDWVAIPGGNLGNVSALHRGFELLRRVGLIDRLPRVLCAQTEAANPLARSFRNGFAPLEPVVAGETAATAIRIGNPVSFDKAVRALRATDGVVDSVSEEEIDAATRRADTRGLYVCPQTAVALAAVERQCAVGVIERGHEVVVVATAHGLKFSEHKAALSGARDVVAVADDYSAVRDAALAGR